MGHPHGATAGPTNLLSCISTTYYVTLFTHHSEVYGLGNAKSGSIGTGDAHGRTLGSLQMEAKLKTNSR